MFRAIYLRELTRDLKNISTSVFFVLMLFCVYMFSSNVDPDKTIFFRLGKEFHNAPVVIARMFAALSAFGMLFSMVIIGRSVTKDFDTQIHEFFFSYPIRKSNYLWGRFWGSFTANVCLYSSVVIGFLLGCAVIDESYSGPSTLMTYVFPIVVVLLPNLFLTGSIFFALATLTRKMVWTYVAGVILFLTYLTLAITLNDIESDTTKILADPFGMFSIQTMLQNWTVHDLNTRFLPLTRTYILNRMLWISVGLACMAITWIRFRMIAHSERPIKKHFAVSRTLSVRAISSPEAILPTVCEHSTVMQLKKTLHLSSLEFRRIVFNPAFIILILFALSQVMSNFYLNSGADGSDVHPVTSWYLKHTDMMWGFLIPLTILFGGLLVWRERDCRTHEIYDSYPMPDWVTYLSKLLALMSVQLLYVICLLVTGLLTQIVFFGFFDIELGLYIKTLFGVELLSYWFSAVLVILIHTMAPNKYLGFFICAFYYIAEVMIFSIWKFDHGLLRYGAVPAFMYSNLKGFGHSAVVIMWYQIYWSLGALFLAGITSTFWRRGTDISVGQRIRLAIHRITRTRIVGLIGLLTVFLSTGGWIAFNRYGLNDYWSQARWDELHADYEKNYKRYETTPQPSMTGMRVEVDLFPETRDARSHVLYRLVNKTDDAIDTILLTFFDPGGWKLQSLECVPKAMLVSLPDDPIFKVYKLEEPLQPGSEMQIRFDLAYETTGFTDNNAMPELAENGIHFGSSTEQWEYFPQIGYNSFVELSEPYARAQHGLPERPGLPPLETADPSIELISSDWIEYEALISTSADHTAVTNGRLVEEKRENNRNTFRYASKMPIPNLIEFMSGRYEIARDRHEGVDIEVYHDNRHSYNVKRMMDGVKRGLDYNGESFCPYPFDVLRIVETPNMEHGVARSQPTIFSWTEDGGFISNLDDPEQIDQVFLISVHEMTHQWWGYIVTPAMAEGAFMFTETVAQYVSEMCLEKEYGKEIVRKHLADEMKSYLTQRSRDRTGERPLVRALMEQSYLNYPKSSVVMYALQDYIGEDSVNRALGRIVDEFGFADDRFPTSHDLIREFRDETPDELQYLITDLFESITLYDNRSVRAVSRKTEKGYEVELTVSVRKYHADAIGKETDVPLADYLTVGVFGENGEELYLRKHFVTEPETTFKIPVTKKPIEAGIDPYVVLIDRERNDNRVTVE